MSQRYVTVTIETRRSDFYSDIHEVPDLNAIWNFDLARDGAQVEAQAGPELHAQLLQLLEEYREANR